MKSRERLATPSRQHSTMLDICRALYSEKSRAIGRGLRNPKFLRSLRGPQRFSKTGLSPIITKFLRASSVSVPPLLISYKSFACWSSYVLCEYQEQTKFYVLVSMFQCGIKEHKVPRKFLDCLKSMVPKNAQVGCD